MPGPDLSVAELIAFTHQQLKAAYPETCHHQNKAEIFQELLYIFLTWRTPITTAQSIFEKIYAHIQASEDLYTWDQAQWFSFLKPGGKAHDKARTAVKLLATIRADFGSIVAFETFLRTQTDADLLACLTRLPGIKVKSACCIMLYALQRPVFPADAHCLRIANRLGLIQIDMANKQARVEAQKQLNRLMDGDYTLCYDVHTKMIVHGQKVCRPRPNCQHCCLKEICEYHLNQE